jgi:hypothetical protein
MKNRHERHKSWSKRPPNVFWYGLMHFNALLSPPVAGGMASLDKNHHRAPIVRRLFVLLILATGCAPAPCPPVVTQVDVMQPVPDPSTPRLLVVGDTQHTLWTEKWLLCRESNEAPRCRLRQELVAQGASTLLHLGDAVARGSSASDWNAFDDWFSPLKAAGIELRGVRGNHDTSGTASDGLLYWRSRFVGDWRQPWWRWDWHGLRFLGIDTNLPGGSDAARQQHAWFVKQLIEADSDPTVQVVAVASHVPPFSNSPVAPPSVALRQHYVPAFCSHKKSLLWLSGHAHGYEHFVRGSPMGCGTGAPHHFIVSAGGGGPRPENLLPSSETGWIDAFAGTTPRPFNFLVIERAASTIRLRVVGFDSSAAPERELEALTLAIPRDGEDDAPKEICRLPTCN